MRSLAPHVGNPRTPQQVAQRDKLSVCVKTLRPWQEVLKVGYPGINGEKGWSGAIRANIREVNVESGTPSLPFASIKFTNSTIGAQINVTIKNGTATIAWEPQSSPEIADNGYMCFAYKNTDSDIVNISIETIETGTKEITSTVFEKQTDWVCFLYDSSNVTAAQQATHTPAG